MNAYRFDDMKKGLSEEFVVVITKDMMDSFQKLSGDVNPMHTDEEWAKGHGFQARLVYGMLTASFYSTLVGMYLPGRYSLLQEISTSFYKPVFIGDRLKVIGIVKEINEALQRVTILARIENVAGQRVSKAMVVVGFYE